MKWGTFKDFFGKNWLSYTTFLASWKKRYISRNCRNCDIWWSKIISLNKTKNSFNSIAKTSLRWSLLIQYYECNSELNDLPQKIRNGVLLVVKECWKKIISNHEQLGLFLSEEKARLWRIFHFWLILFIGLSGNGVNLSKFLAQKPHLMHYPLPYKIAFYNCITLLRISII